MELMLVPLCLMERALLFSDDDDIPLCIKCEGIEFIESKNFLLNFCSWSPACFRSDFNWSFSDCRFSIFCSNSSLYNLSYRITYNMNII